MGVVNKYPKNRKSCFIIKTPLRDRDTLYNQYIVLNKSAKEISFYFGVKVSFVKELLSSFNIKKEGSGKFTKKIITMADDEVSYLYKEEFKTIDEIAVLAGSTYWCIQESLKRTNTTRRKGDSRLVNGHPMAGKKVSFDTRKKQSIAKTGIDTKDWKGFSSTCDTKSPEWRKWRTFILKRDNMRCMDCKNEKDLQAHHILMRALFPEYTYDVYNGITLCKKCHASIRGLERSLETKFFTVLRDHEIYKWSGLGQMKTSEIVDI